MSKLVVASETLAAGLLTRRELSRSHQRVFRNVYARRDVELTAEDKAVAAWLWSGRRATVAGLSAATLLGSRWVPPNAPAELTRLNQWAPPGIVVHTGGVRDDEMCVVQGIDCTTAARTGYDLGRRLPFVEGVIRVDALLSATNIPVQEIAAIAARYAGARGIRRLRQVLALADGGAESPQETRVRLLLMRAGLPRPSTQIRVGRRRIDMGWPEWKVGVEYDGAQHWTDPQQHAGDIERLEYFVGQGWRIVRVSAAHLRFDAHLVPERAAAALYLAGWRQDSRAEA